MALSLANLLAHLRGVWRVRRALLQAPVRSAARTRPVSSLLSLVCAVQDTPTQQEGCACMFLAGIQH